MLLYKYEVAGMHDCGHVMGYLKGIKIMPRTKKTTPTTASKKESAVKPVEKAAARAAEVKAEVKAVPAPAEAPKAEAKKPAAKTAKKSSKPATKKATPAKRAPRKSKPITTDDIVAKVYKRINKAAAKSIAAEGKAAVDIKLYGPFEAHMYIEIKNGVVSVAPYDYIEKDIEAAISVENALAIADGKLSVKDAVENGSLYVFGNVQFALKLAKLFD